MQKCSNRWDDHIVFMLFDDVKCKQQLFQDGAERVLPEGEVGQLGRASHEDVKSGNIGLLQGFGGCPDHYGIAKLKTRKCCHAFGHL